MNSQYFNYLNIHIVITSSQQSILIFSIEILNNSATNFSKQSDEREWSINIIRNYSSNYRLRKTIRGEGRRRLFTSVCYREDWTKRLKRRELALFSNFLPPPVGSSSSSSSSSSLRSRLFLTLLLAWAGCNRFPEARAHYRPVGLAITCEASFDFVCASQRSFRLSTSPSEILRRSFQRGTEKRRERKREREGKARNIQRNGSLRSLLLLLLPLHRATTR